MNKSLLLILLMLTTSQGCYEKASLPNISECKFVDFSELPNQWEMACRGYPYAAGDIITDNIWSSSVRVGFCGNVSSKKHMDMCGEFFIWEKLQNELVNNPNFNLPTH